MDEDQEFSLEVSEELINNLKSNVSPELEKLRSTLNLLGHVHELSPISIPPVLPSEIGQPVQLLTRNPSKTRRTLITSILSVGILASASLAAAAVTGRGPAPIVNAGHQSAKIVKAVAGAISNAVTGKNDESPAEPAPAFRSPGVAPSSGNEQGGDGSEDSEHSLTGPSSLPTSEGDDDATNSNDSNDDEGISPSLTSVPKAPSKKPDHSSENEGFRTPTPEPTTINPSGIPKPTSSPEDDSSDDADNGDDD